MPFRRGGEKITSTLSYTPGQALPVGSAILKADAIFLATGSADRSASVAFVRSYKKAFRLPLDSFSALGQDATRALLRGIEDSKDAGPKKVRAALASCIHLAGLTGPIVLNKSQRIPKKPVALVDASEPDNRTLQMTPILVPAP
jgi:ABC-type branched-subunit amino acid transport system substrate-binding protein